MRDWRAELESAMAQRHRDRALTRETLDELADHVQDVYAAALAAGRSEQEARASGFREIDAVLKRAHTLVPRRRAAVVRALSGDLVRDAHYTAMRPLVASQLFGVTPFDPRIIAAVVALLTLSALAAACVPARRAASVDPLVVLKAE